MRDAIDQLTEAVIGAAFEVSNQLGVGFLEKVYENALVHEMRRRGIGSESQKRVVVRYKDAVVGDYVIDALVEEQLVVELKCCDAFAPEHVAQCLNYRRATGLRYALLLNFQKPRVEIKRIAL